MHTTQGVVAFALGTLLIALARSAASGRRPPAAPRAAAPRAPAGAPAARPRSSGWGSRPSSLRASRASSAAPSAPRRAAARFAAAALDGRTRSRDRPALPRLGALRPRRSASTGRAAAPRHPRRRAGAGERVRRRERPAQPRERGCSRRRTGCRGAAGPSRRGEPRISRPDDRRERVIASAEGRRVALLRVVQGPRESPGARRCGRFLALDQSPFQRAQRAYVVRLYDRASSRAARARPRRAARVRRAAPLRHQPRGAGSALVVEGAPREGWGDSPGPRGQQPGAPAGTSRPPLRGTHGAARGERGTRFLRTGRKKVLRARPIRYLYCDRWQPTRSGTTARWRGRS